MERISKEDQIIGKSIARDLAYLKEMLNEGTYSLLDGTVLSQNQDMINISKLTTQQKVRHWYNSSTFGLISDLCQVVLSFLSAVLYVVSTYVDDKQFELNIFWLEVGFAIFFLGYYIIQFYMATNRYLFVISIFSIVDYFTFYPIIYSFIVGEIVVQFSFLRFIRVIRLVRILRSHRLLQSKSLSMVQRQVFLLGFSVLILLFCASGIMFAIEFQSRDLYFHDSLYFVVVTLSTVGYGDISPESGAGRATVVVIIWLSVLLLPSQIDRLNKLMKLQQLEASLKLHEIELENSQNDPWRYFRVFYEMEGIKPVILFDLYGQDVWEKCHKKSQFDPRGFPPSHLYHIRDLVLELVSPMLHSRNFSQAEPIVVVTPFFLEHSTLFSTIENLHPRIRSLVILIQGDISSFHVLSQAHIEHAQTVYLFGFLKSFGESYSILVRKRNRHCGIYKITNDNYSTFVFQSLALFSQHPWISALYRGLLLKYPFIDIQMHIAKMRRSKVGETVFNPQHQKIHFQNLVGLYAHHITPISLSEIYQFFEEENRFVLVISKKKSLVIELDGEGSDQTCLSLIEESDDDLSGDSIIDGEILSFGDIFGGHPQNENQILDNTTDVPLQTISSIKSKDSASNPPETTYLQRSDLINDYDCIPVAKDNSRFLIDHLEAPWIILGVDSVTPNDCKMFQLVVSCNKTKQWLLYYQACITFGADQIDDSFRPLVSILLNAVDENLQKIIQPSFLTRESVKNLFLSSVDDENHENHENRGNPQPFVSTSIPSHPLSHQSNFFRFPVQLLKDSIQSLEITYTVPQIKHLAFLLVHSQITQAHMFHSMVLNISTSNKKPLAFFSNNSFLYHSNHISDPVGETQNTFPIKNLWASPRELAFLQPEKPYCASEFSWLAHSAVTSCTYFVWPKRIHQFAQTDPYMDPLCVTNDFYKLFNSNRLVTIRLLSKNPVLNNQKSILFSTLFHHCLYSSQVQLIGFSTLSVFTIFPKKNDIVTTDSLLYGIRLLPETIQSSSSLSPRLTTVRFDSFVPPNGFESLEMS